jgi:hypothetical protein
MVCLWDICVNTLHKGDSIFTNNNNNNNDNNNNNNNNNNALFHQSVAVRTHLNRNQLGPADGKVAVNTKCQAWRRSKSGMEVWREVTLYPSL